jgi:hypothetical protein
MNSGAGRRFLPIPSLLLPPNILPVGEKIRQKNHKNGAD